FLGLWMMRPDVQETIRTQGFTTHDFFRLHQKWSAFFFENPEEMKFSPPLPDAEVVVPELQLGAWDLDAAFGEYRAAVKALSNLGAAEATEASPADAEEPVDNPPLFAPLPSQGARADLGEG